jgi:hypothetical protein
MTSTTTMVPLLKFCWILGPADTRRGVHAMGLDSHLHTIEWISSPTVVSCI